MRFWPRTPENLEIKLPDEFRHCNVRIAGGDLEAQCNFYYGTGLVFVYHKKWQKRKHILILQMHTFFTVPKEMEEIRDSICDCHMEYSARKIYQPANVQFLVLNLTYESCFSSYKWKSLNI